MEDALKRYNQGKYRFSAQFIAGDCCDPSLRKEFEALDFFDVVSCQFAIHYSFERKERAREFVRNVSSKMREGAYFIGTTVDAKVLTERVKMSEDGKSAENAQYKVEFDEKVDSIQNGQRYVFSLEDAVTRVPEYVVDPLFLIEICAEEGLECVRMQNLYSLYHESISSPQWDSISSKQNIPRDSTGFDPDTWETIGLYMAFVFRKKGTPDSIRHSPPFSRHGQRLRPSRLQIRDIIHLSPSQ